MRGWSLQRGMPVSFVPLDSVSGRGGFFLSTNMCAWLDSRRFLPSLYNRGFDKREQKARALLQSLNEAGGSGPGRGTRRKRAGSSG